MNTRSYIDGPCPSNYIIMSWFNSDLYYGITKLPMDPQCAKQHMMKVRMTLLR